MSLWCSGQGVACIAADKPGSAPGDAVFCFLVAPFFFSVWSLFFNTVFPFGPFFFILTSDHADHALWSIYISSLSPEFCFGKGISKVLDLHTGQAYDQKKPLAVKTCTSSETAECFSMFVTSWQTTHSTPKTVLIYTIVIWEDRLWKTTNIKHKNNGAAVYVGSSLTVCTILCFLLANCDGIN